MALEMESHLLFQVTETGKQLCYIGKLYDRCLQLLAFTSSDKIDKNDQDAIELSMDVGNSAEYTLS